MIKEIEKECEEKMEKSLDSLKNDLKKIRTGKAQVSMLDPVKVSYYGTPTPLNQIASISCPDPKSFLITPWDANALKPIEEAILNSQIGMAPQNDGKTIRLKVPELTEERRKELVKMTKKMGEESKVAMRMTRRHANEKIKSLEKEKKIGEDEQKEYLEHIQKFTDEYVKKINQILEVKEKDLLSF